MATLLAIALLSACAAEEVDGTRTSASGLTVTRREASLATGKTAITASCEEGETLLSGGCECADDGGGITSSRREAESWVCSCDQTSGTSLHTATALCSSTTGLSRTEVQATIPAPDTVATVSCTDPEVLTAAAITCGSRLNTSGILQGAGSSSSIAATASCDSFGTGGSSGFLTAQCFTGMTLTQSSQTTALDGDVSTETQTLSCADGTVLVGGGCQCGAGQQLLASLSEPNLLTQTCTCTGGGAGNLVVSVLCAD